jgi:hypothetical protein
MRITFRTNLGRSDARRLGLDYSKCTAGSTCDVEQDVAVALVSQGIATAKDVLKAVPVPAAVQGVPAQPEVQGVPAEDSRSTKPSRKPRPRVTDETDG